MSCAAGEDPRTAIRAFVAELLRAKGARPIADDGEPLVTSGRLDSLEVVELAVFLEDRFGVAFAEVGFDAAELDSVDAIVALVGRRGPARA